MTDVSNLIKTIQLLQEKTNEAIISKNTEISKKENILQEIDLLQKEAQKEFDCSVDDLIPKKEEYEKEINENINSLKQLLGME